MPLFPNQDLRNKDYKDLEAGDETHRYGDYLPYDFADSYSHEIGDLVTVTADEDLAEVTASDDGAGNFTGLNEVIFGVHYSNKYEGSVATGPDRDATVDTSQGATVKASGSAVVRLPEYDSDGNGTLEPIPVSTGDTIGAENNVLVLHVSDSGEFAELLFR